MTRRQQWDIDMYVFLYLSDCSEWVSESNYDMEGVMSDNQTLRVVGHGMH